MKTTKKMKEELELMSMSGTLSIEIIEGNLIRNTETWGNMDPFIVLQYKDSKFKTSVINDGGKNPHWDQAFDIPV
jgi:Ca2+-dependent lipid-binding protein